MSNLTGKIILMTGSLMGIGRAIATSPNLDTPSPPLTVLMLVTDDAP